MNTTKIFSVAVAMLFIIAFTSAPIFAATIAPLQQVNSITKVDGGPRDIIHGMTTLTVLQQEPEYLGIVIVDEYENIVFQGTTESLSTKISISGWSAGDYSVHTSCEHNNQVFYFTIE